MGNTFKKKKNRYDDDDEYELIDRIKNKHEIRKQRKEKKNRLDHLNDDDEE